MSKASGNIFYNSIARRALSVLKGEGPMSMTALQRFVTSRGAFTCVSYAWLVQVVRLGVDKGLLSTKREGRYVIVGLTPKGKRACELMKRYERIVGGKTSSQLLRGEVTHDDETLRG